MSGRDPRDAWLTGLAERFVDQLAQARALGLTVLDASARHVQLKLPYQEAMIGYPDSRVVHGGVITTLMDTACGAAVICAIRDKEQQLELSPTLDLRVDYMKPAQPDRPIYGYAQCYKLTEDVAFTRGIAYQDSLEKPIAQVVGSFMRIGSDLVTPEFRQQLEGQESTTRS